MTSSNSLLRNHIKDTYCRDLVWQKLYGFKSILLHLLACSQVWCMVHQLLEQRDPELFSVFRSSQVSECTGVAVAGTITATIAITSMALPSLDQLHWIVRALWFSSVLTGLVAVLYACNQQITMARNIRWRSLWKWMNNDWELDEDAVAQEHQDYLVPDFFAVLLLSAPKVILHYSLNAYIVGIAVYLGLLWKDQVDTDGAVGDDRNIFIFFMVVIGFSYPLYWLSDIANRCRDMPFEWNWKRLCNKDK